MRVVLNTNVLLNALISPHAAPDLIFKAWRSHRFEVITSRTQIDELRRVSRYPKLKAILHAHRISSIVKHMQRAVVLEHLPSFPDGIEVNDPNGTFLVAMALAGEADYVVTGERRAGLLKLGNIGTARIVTPSIFCATAL